MNSFSRHAEWLRLVEVSGPFLAVPVLEKAFPQGLDAVTESRQFLRRAHEEWREAVTEADPQLPALHREWVRLVLEELLEYDRESLMPSSRLDGALSYTVLGHSVTVTPDFAIFSGGSARLLVSVYPPNTDLEKALAGDVWPASPLERTTLLCRATGVRIGLVTDGERWTMVNAPVGATSGHATWYARFWWQEPVTLKAFQSLLGVRRCFGPAEDTLETLLEESLQHQEEITDTLGEQVRRAVEVLIQALDRADQDRNRELLRGVAPSELYEAGLTIMMRLVFVLCAEERGLLLLGDPVYDRCYAVSTLRVQLAEEAAQSGQEVLERRHDAWSRLLAVFRSVYGGVEHENLRLPALGGSLFDPDRFPFLEGRRKEASWRDSSAIPLPIDNRTVLMLLTALQVLEQRGGALSLSYKALDVEQVGHVYEGLLEHTVVPLTQTTLGLVGSQRAKNPNAALGELESARLDGERALLDLLLKVTGRSESALRNALAREVDEALQGKVLHACGGDTELAGRIYPFANLLRTDNWGDPLVYRQGAFAVTLGADRRETGTHYTPKSLTETIVETTLEPVVYHGPADGALREEWRLKRPAELLDLKVCDPAMGSGAFLVQICRWLAVRLVEAWGHEEAAGKAVSVDGEVLEQATGRELLPTQLDDRLLIARRIVAERCLYGVDLNPLAVELAKLSIWLVTLAKGRPFGFLDHNLRCGDTLLGIHRLEEATELTMVPVGKGSQMRLFGRNIESAVHEAIRLRQRIREMSIRDIRDVQTMVGMDASARRLLEAPERVADALVGEALRTKGKLGALESSLQALAAEAQSYLDGDLDAGRLVTRRAREALAVDLPIGRPSRRPFHWPLEFPEVFARENSGFDAFVGNPPFLGGQRITGILGTAYRDYIVAYIAEGRRGSADLVAYFFLRSYALLRNGGGFGLLAVNTISEGDTRQVGIEAMVRHGAIIHAAFPNLPWPGKAMVVTSRVHVHKGNWSGLRTLLGRPVKHISAFLSDHEEWSPKRLKANAGLGFIGTYVLGMGFVLIPDDAQRMLDADPRNAEVIYQYLNGEDLNSDSEQRPSRWVINFWDWPEERAREYRLPYKWIEERVKPERQRRNERGEFALRRPLPERWWQFGEKRPGLYHAIGRGHHFQHHPEGWNPSLMPMKNVLVCSLVQNYLKFALVPNTHVFAHRLAILAIPDFSSFALLSSTLYQVWTRKTSSTMRVDLNYSPSDSFETFPFPNFIDFEVAEIGELYGSLRQKIMVVDSIGLTRLYNRFHTHRDNENCISDLRELHRELDEAVARAYGWDDLDLDHGFHDVPYLPEKDRVRFTISERARIEVLRRLSELNRQRYEEEVAEGLHGKQSMKARRSRGPQRGQSTQTMMDFGEVAAKPAARSSAKKHRRTYQEPENEYPLAAEGQAAHKKGCPPRSGTFASAVFDFLHTHPSWHAKSDVLAATGISDGEWNAAISALVADGLVERQGERRGARYRVISKPGGQQ